MKSGFMKFIDGYESTRLGKRFLSLSYSGSVSSKNKKTKALALHKIGEKISSFFAATRSTFYGALFGIFAGVLADCTGGFGIYFLPLLYMLCGYGAYVCAELIPKKKFSVYPTFSPKSPSYW